MRETRETIDRIWVINNDESDSGMSCLSILLSCLVVLILIAIFVAHM